MNKLSKELVSSVSNCAQDLEIAKNTDWGYITLDEKQVYDDMTELVLLEYASIEPDLRELSMLAILVATLVQNQVLLMQMFARR